MEGVEMAYREMMSVVLEKQAGVTAEVDFLRLMGCFSHEIHRRKLSDLWIRPEEIEDVYENVL